jgi:hypothetical protein
MLPASRDRILALLDEGDPVLDVGGWASPFPRADWVIDRAPYETRGLYGAESGEPERFSEITWVQRDVCDREPWPFADDQFAFAVCSHTLEDVRDPVWVCAEMVRVARAGYVEVPSRLEEQTPGLQGPWVGWGHHHWLCTVDQAAGHLEFVFKHHIVHGRPEMQYRGAPLSPEERVQQLWWEGSFSFAERIFDVPEELDAWLAAPVAPAPRRRWLR